MLNKKITDCINSGRERTISPKQVKLQDNNSNEKRKSARIEPPNFKSKPLHIKDTLMCNEFMFFDSGLIDCSNFNNTNRESITQSNQRKLNFFKRKEMSLEVLNSQRKVNKTIDQARFSHSYHQFQREC